MDCKHLAENEICTNAVNRIEKTITQFTYDEENIHIQTNSITKNKAAFIDCLKAQCGAYKNGSCQYKE